MRNKLIGLSVAVVLVLGVWLVLWLRSERQPDAVSANTQPVHSMQPLQSVSSGDKEPWQLPRLTAQNYQSQYGPLPESLKGTRIPFDLEVDTQNQLIVDQRLRRLFDYFFTLVGEESLATIQLRIEELLANYLPEPANSQALTIFAEYVALKEAEIELREQLAADYQASGEQLALQERVRLMRELRQSMLSPAVYDAFFREEDQRSQYALQRHQILQDDSLSLTQRNMALRQLDSQLPPELQAEKEQEYLYQELQQQIQQAREQGATDSEIFQLRSEAYGAEAAERFAQADKQQAQWDSRVAAYREQRGAILESGLSEADQQAEIARLRAQHFSGPELMRIPVIDRMYDEQGKP